MQNSTFKGFTIIEHTLIKKAYYITKLFVIGLLALLMCMPFLYASENRTIPLTTEELDYLKDIQTITMAVDPNWKPYEALDDQGNFTGIAADLLDLIEQRLAIKFEIIPTASWIETLELSKSSNVMLIPFLSKTPARDEWLNFTDPLFIDPTIIISHTETPYISDLTTLENKTIAFPEGTSLEELVRMNYPNLNIITFPTEREALEAVGSGKADLALRSLTIAAYTIRSEGLINLKFDAILAEYNTTLRMGVLKEHSQLLPILNKAIGSITASEKESIINKHVYIVFTQLTNTRQLVLIALLALAVILVILYWNHRIRQEIRQREKASTELRITQTRFYELEQQSESYTWEYNLDGILTYVSPGIEAVLGLKPEDLIYKSHFGEMMPQEDYDAIKELGMRILKNAEPLSKYENRQIHTDGTVRWFATNGIPVLDGNGAPIAYRGVDVDITEQKNAQIALEKSEARIRTIVEVSNIGAWEFNAITNIYWCSPEYFTMLGYSKDAFPTSGDFKGPYKELIDSLIYPEDLEKAKEKLFTYLDSNVDTFYDSYFRMKRVDDSWAWIRSRGRRIKSTTGDLIPIIIGTHIDVSDLKEVQEEILNLSYKDQLTGVYNRRYFEDQLHFIDTDENLPISCIMADVNGLKLMNDAFGHQAGDELLVKSAQIIATAFRATDLVARLGGDEFIVLMPKANEVMARERIMKIQQTLGQEQVHSLNISISFGSSTKSDPSGNIYDTIKFAENQMYQEKIEGKDRNRHETIDIIMERLFQKCPEEASHAQNVSLLSYLIGVNMGLESKQLNDLKRIGYFHDIGKIAISTDILNRKPPFNDEELKEFRRHTETGYNILSTINDYAGFAEIILCHHENWDGTGYPKKLKGNAIPLFSRIISVADAYEATENQRHHAISNRVDHVLEDLRNLSGIQFDPLVIQALEHVLSQSD